MCTKTCMLLAAVSALFANSVQAAVSADEAKQLGGSVLTAWGAEKAGNKEGTIPAYTGEAVKVPSCFNPKEPSVYCDPWNEKPLTVVTAQNMAQYADKLTAGQKELLKKFPDFKMNIYPTHRTQLYPKYILENTVKNATSCKNVKDGLEIEGCYGGLPFPIPKTGNEAVWNHLVRYAAYTYAGKVRSIFVDTNGKAVNQGEHEVYNTQFNYDPKRTTPITSESLYYGVRLDTYAPARRNGEKLIVLSYMNNDQRVYQYLPGQRRVKLAPDVAYDTPSPVSGGGQTMDEQILFFGHLDRFNFKLIGKTEKFINYNNFALSDYRVCPENVYATKGFPNPECSRWELHRVWHVHASLKPGFRNILPERDLYFDEDNPGMGTADNFDAAGHLFHIDDVQSYPYYDQPYGSVGNIGSCIDIQKGTWTQGNFQAFKGGGYSVVNEVKPMTFWSPESLAGEGVR